MFSHRIIGFKFLVLVICIAFAQRVLTPSAVAQESAVSVRALFNGKSLEGWDGDPRFWRVEAGELIGETTESNKAEKNTFLIWRDGEASDFDLRVKYRVAGGNSGVQYRSREVNKWSVSGYQADFEAQHHKSDNGLIDKYSGMFFEEQGRLFMGQRGQAVMVRSNMDKPKKPTIDIIGSVGNSSELEQVIRRDDWNDLRIIARQFSFIHIINDRVMSVAIDEDVINRKASGIIAFQLHAGPPMQIRIKDVTLRELKPTETP